MSLTAEERVDIDQAMGTALAALCVQGALAVTLMTKGALTAEEFAEALATALEGAQTSFQATPGARLMAEEAIRGFSGFAGQQLRRN